MSKITQYVLDATRLRLADPATGFNATVAQALQAYGLPALSIDWSDSSTQYFEAFLGPDDIDDSTPSKYPMVFLHGLASDNAHDAKPRAFSGTVEVALSFWLTERATDARKAGKALERKCSAIEDAINALFADGNWPQLWGAQNALLVRYPSQRSRIEIGAEHWRKSILFRLTFQVDE
ncbi:MAG: hypothetical protein KGL39_37585 [Patescibacteria group bacterium]|nr:hypothetical protein [Patescibacteria group bacterium]